MNGAYLVGCRGLGKVPSIYYILENQGTANEPLVHHISFQCQHLSMDLTVDVSFIEMTVDVRTCPDP